MSPPVSGPPVRAYPLIANRNSSYFKLFVRPLFFSGRTPYRADTIHQPPLFVKSEFPHTLQIPLGTSFPPFQKLELQTGPLDLRHQPVLSR